MRDLMETNTVPYSVNFNFPESPEFPFEADTSDIDLTVLGQYHPPERKDEKTNKSELSIPPPYPAPEISPVLISSRVKFRTWFNPYRWILAIVIGLNCGLFGLTITGHGEFMATHLSLMVISNLLVASAVRNEWILRLIYWGSIMTFRWNWVPKKVKIIVVGLLYHIGGLHSGCGSSSLLWVAIAGYRHFQEREKYNPAILASLFLSIFCVLTCCMGALPIIRQKHHNFFEATHRFLGWLGISSTLAFVMTSAWWDPNLKAWRVFGTDLTTQIDFWFVFAMIVLTLSSWVTVVKVPVTYVHISNKASVLRMPGGLTSGLHTRISHGGLKEWHIFGSISEGKYSDDHYLVIAVQGDFTRMLNTQQPESLYTKTWKPCGLPYFSRLFNRGVAICTGSGIGAIGSTCIQHQSWFLVWIGPNLEATYGKTFLDLIRARIGPERRIIWDTRLQGRPDVPLELAKVFHKWNADVALFIGSPALNKQVLRSCRVRKIPVYGSIWDA